MDRAAAKNLSDDVKDALEAVARKHGLTLSYTGGRFTTGTFRPTVTFEEAHHAADEFNVYRSRFGINPEVQCGVTFTLQGETYRVRSIRPRAQKRPIVASNERTGQEYVFGVDTVNRAVAAGGGR